MALRPLTPCTWATTKAAVFLAGFVVVLCCLLLGVDVTSDFDPYSKGSYSHDPHPLLFTPLYGVCTKTEAENFKLYFQSLMWAAPRLKRINVRCFQCLTFAMNLVRKDTDSEPKNTIHSAW